MPRIIQSPEHFGPRLKEIRTAAGLTQTQLAVKVGSTQAYISGLESGKKREPSLALAIRIADALGVALGKLIGNAINPADAS